MSLAKYFRYNAIDVSGFYIGNHTNNAKAEFTIFEQLKHLVDNSDVIMLTVTDSQISEVWSRLAQIDISNKVICHCSGSLSSELFINRDKKNAYACSLHPILPFETQNKNISQISKAFFTIEGDDLAVDMAKNILDICGNPYYVIDKQNKAKYHCAACFASNFVIAVCQKAVDLLCECGFGKDDALKALMPLICANIDNIKSNGLVNSLTGPVERNDILTVQNHINSLNDNDTRLYKMLTSILVDIAECKNGKRDYSTMEGLL